LLHISLEANSLPGGALPLNIISNSIEEKYGDYSKWSQNEDLKELYRKEWGKKAYEEDKNNPEIFRANVVLIYYKKDLGEMAAEYKDGVKRSPYVDGLFSKNGFAYDPKTKRLVGYGKYRKYTLKNVESPAESIRSRLKADGTLHLEADEMENLKNLHNDIETYLR
jgi:hypothetical protein